jgi:hypothetical protein
MTDPLLRTTATDVHVRFNRFAKVKIGSFEDKISVCSSTESRPAVLCLPRIMRSLAFSAAVPA